MNNAEHIYGGIHYLFPIDKPITHGAKFDYIINIIRTEAPIGRAGGEGRFHPHPGAFDCNGGTVYWCTGTIWYSGTVCITYWFYMVRNLSFTYGTPWIASGRRSTGWQQNPTG